jgi:hypothetical protein
LKPLTACALLLGALAILPGCVVGSGPCLWLGPVKHSFTGHVHFRDFPEADGVDNVPILILDKTTYVYAPAESLQCQPANDIQMIGLAEFPRDVGEDTEVTVKGNLMEGVADRQHTRFVLSVTSVLPVPRPR